MLLKKQNVLNRMIGRVVKKKKREGNRREKVGKNREIDGMMEQRQGLRRPPEASFRRLNSKKKKKKKKTSCQ